MERLLEATRLAERTHFWFRGFRRFVGLFLDEAAPTARRPRILDCGCGTGINFELLEKHGRSFGCELAWTGVAFARGYHRRLAQASVTHLPFPDASFDVVTSFDVLYGLHDRKEEAAVGEMYRVLRPGGAALVNVAAMRILTGNHSVLGAEVRRYNTRRLRRVLEAAGFSIVRITHTNASLFPMMLAVRMGQRLAGLATPEEAGREIAVPPAAINALLSGLLALESAALRRINMPFGSSLLCLARKPLMDHSHLSVTVML